MAAFQIPAADLTAYETGFQPRPVVATAPVTCAACGCRLQDATSNGTAVYRHFSGAPGRDARGCSVACVGSDHDAHGTAIVTA